METRKVEISLTPFQGAVLLSAWAYFMVNTSSCVEVNRVSDSIDRNTAAIERLRVEIAADDECSVEEKTQ